MTDTKEKLKEEAPKVTRQMIKQLSRKYGFSNKQAELILSLDAEITAAAGFTMELLLAMSELQEDMTKLRLRMDQMNLRLPPAKLPVDAVAKEDKAPAKVKYKKPATKKIKAKLPN